MKKRWIPLLALVLMLAASVPPASAAPDRGWGGRDERGAPHEFHGGGGCPGCAFVGGLLLGGLMGRMLAAPYAAPPLVYAQPAPSACYTQPGYWGQMPTPDPGGYPMYQTVWVPPQTRCQ